MLCSGVSILAVKSHCHNIYQLWKTEITPAWRIIADPPPHTHTSMYTQYACAPDDAIPTASSNAQVEMANWPCFYHKVGSAEIGFNATGINGTALPDGAVCLFGGDYNYNPLNEVWRDQPDYITTIPTETCAKPPIAGRQCKRQLHHYMRSRSSNPRPACSSAVMLLHFQLFTWTILYRWLVSC